MGTLVYAENYESQTAGSLPAGHTQLVGTTWQVQTNLVLQGTKSFSSVASGAPANAQGVAITATGILTDYEKVYSSEVRIALTGSPSNQTSGAQYSTVDSFLRCSNSAMTGYACQLVPCGAGGTTGKLYVFRYVNAAATVVGSAYTIPANYWRTGVLTDGDKVFHKLSITGSGTSTTIKWKSWLVGNAEPASYQNTWTDSSGSALNSGYDGWSTNYTSVCFQSAVDSASVMDLTNSTLGCPPISFISSTSTTIDLQVTQATGGVGPYTGQWYESTTFGSLGSAISGATGLYLHRTGLTTATTYFYTYIATDSTGGTALTYSTPQIQVTTAGTAGTIGVNVITMYASATSENEVVCDGVTTTWVSGTTFAAAGAAANVTGKNVVSNTLTVLKVIPGATLGTFTIGDGTNVSATINVVAGSSVIPGASTLRIHNPYNQLTQEAVTITSGPHLSFSFAGDFARLRFNLGTNTVYPRVYYQIDGQGIQFVDLTKASPYVNLFPLYTTATTVKAINHIVDIWVAVFEGAGSPWGAQNQWASQLGALRTAALDLAGTASMIALPAINPNYIVCEGDSLTATVHTLYLGGNGDQTVMHVPFGWPSILARGLGSGLIQQGYGGTGVFTAGSGSVPAAPTRYGLAYSGASWTPAVLPYLGIIYHGTNDGAATSLQFQTGYVNLMAAMRTQSPNIILMCVNPHPCNGGGSRLADINAAIATAGAGSYAFSYDAATLGLAGNNLENGGSGVHLSPGGNVMLGVQMRSWAQTLLNTLGIKAQIASTGFSY